MVKMRFIALMCVAPIALFAAEHSTSDLLPQRMLPTQRILWGEQGLLRKTQIVPLNRENRFAELEARSRLFTAHRILGYTTAAEMLATGLTGLRLASGDQNFKDAHEALLVATNVTYFGGLSIALLSPPSKRGSSSPPVALHKILCLVHLAGMITTDILGKSASSNPQSHKIAAISTFAVYSIASIVVHF